jgi:hypothetical protein
MSALVDRAVAECAVVIRRVEVRTEATEIDGRAVSGWLGNTLNVVTKSRPHSVVSEALDASETLALTATSLARLASVGCSIQLLTLRAVWS